MGDRENVVWWRGVKKRKKASELGVRRSQQSELHESGSGKRMRHEYTTFSYRNCVITVLFAVSRRE